MKTCLHFGSCGGCRSLDVPYEEQLAAKSAKLGELFADHWTDPIHVEASPTIYYYRNKVELKFDRAQYPEPPPKDFVRPTVVGFHERGRWYSTLDVEECKIFSPVIPKLLPEIRKWYRFEDGVRYWNQRDKSGLLKYLVLREGKRTGDRIVVVVTAEGDFDKTKLVEAVLRADENIGVFHGIQRSKGDVVMPEELIHLHGPEVLREDLHLPDGDGVRKLSFEIDPLGFFQVNPPATELLYGAIRERVKTLGSRFVYDFYGGSGGIAFSISDLAPEILSVENFEPASEGGRRNAEINGITNVRFETAAVEKWLGKRMESRDFDSESITILDPPRSSMHPKALRRLIDFAPRDIIYVSCNPKLLARELVDFREKYELTELRAFDLFPHTDHVEALAFLKRR